MRSRARPPRNDRPLLARPRQQTSVARLRRGHDRRAGVRRVDAGRVAVPCFPEFIDVWTDFGFYAVESADAVRFLMRGWQTVATIAPAEFVAPAEASDVSEPTRGQETELPADAEAAGRWRRRGTNSELVEATSHHSRGCGAGDGGVSDGRAARGVRAALPGAGARVQCQNPRTDSAGLFERQLRNPGRAPAAVGTLFAVCAMASVVSATIIPGKHQRTTSDLR